MGKSDENNLNQVNINRGESFCLPSKSHVLNHESIKPETETSHFESVYP